MWRGCRPGTNGKQPQAAEPSDLEDDFGVDGFAALAVPGLEDEPDFDEAESEEVDEEESEDELPESLDGAGLLAEPLPPAEPLPEPLPLLETLRLRESLRESLR